MNQLLTSYQCWLLFVNHWRYHWPPFSMTLIDGETNLVLATTRACWRSLWCSAAAISFLWDSYHWTQVSRFHCRWYSLIFQHMIQQFKDWWSNHMIQHFKDSTNWTSLFCFSYKGRIRCYTWWSLSMCPLAAFHGEAPSDSEPELPLPSQEELAEAERSWKSTFCDRKWMENGWKMAIPNRQSV